MNYCQTCGRDYRDLSKLSDMRRRASSQAAIGNYWAGKVQWLVDLIAEYESELGCDWCRQQITPA